jgi:hypothetical protein
VGGCSDRKWVAEIASAVAALAPGVIQTSLTNRTLGAEGLLWAASAAAARIGRATAAAVYAIWLGIALTFQALAANRATHAIVRLVDARTAHALLANAATGCVVGLRTAIALDDGVAGRAATTPLLPAPLSRTGHREGGKPTHGSNEGGESRPTRSWERSQQIIKLMAVHGAHSSGETNDAWAEMTVTARMVQM